MLEGARPGDVLVLLEGRYQWPDNTPLHCSLQGQGDRDKVVIQGPAGSKFIQIAQGARQLTIENLSLRAPPNDTGSYLHVEGQVTGLSVRNVSLAGAWRAFGIFLGKEVSGIAVEGCEVADVKWGIGCSMKCRGIRLDSNFVHDCATGIFVDDAQVSITGNRLVANEKYDLWLCNAPGATHADNCAEKETEID